MPQADLLHHGLISVPFGGRKPGIYWLRLYALGASRHVAVLTEVPGNPSSSVTNVISRIAAHVILSFGLDSRRLVFFEIWPRRNSTKDLASYKQVVLGQPTTWKSTSREAIEGLLGTRLAPLPGHDALYKQVLDRGGGNREEVRRPVFQAVRVGELPPPHNPSRCAHYDRYRQILEGIGPGPRPRRILGAAIEAGKRFVETLRPQDLRSCAYHDSDWKGIAEASAGIIQALGSRDWSDYAARAKQTRLPTRAKQWLISLFTDPVVIEGGSYTDGQHRGCALRFSGAERAAVVVDSEVVGEVAADWTYYGDG